MFAAESEGILITISQARPPPQFCFTSCCKILQSSVVLNTYVLVAARCAIQKWCPLQWKCNRKYCSVWYKYRIYMALTTNLHITTHIFGFWVLQNLCYRIPPTISTIRDSNLLHHQIHTVYLQDSCLASSFISRYILHALPETYS